MSLCNVLFKLIHNSFKKTKYHNLDSFQYFWSPMCIVLGDASMNRNWPRDCQGIVRFHLWFMPLSLMTTPSYLFSSCWGNLFPWKGASPKWIMIFPTQLVHGEKGYLELRIRSPSFQFQLGHLLSSHLSFPTYKWNYSTRLWELHEIMFVNISFTVSGI